MHVVMLRYNHGASVKYKKSSWVSVFKDGILTAILKASTDFFSMTLFGKEFQSLIVRAIKLCWRLFVCFGTNLYEFLRVELPSALCRLLNNI